ncbi:protein SEED AND ROOT HAIR PROTECTIVE PROTEIN-like [Telopea speciosissima]|uniref:protein SEED AND ROOT HAIR PROTECTIVE PROTEIN-like n=1 Tax=Telopea speciosissima TaxID=54955 RepID=UPI001CC6E75A|nr:protein SEED AND ROOT HAIR PROTECTIVE PROTEIN-like [Telopea speciosissima]
MGCKLLMDPSGMPKIFRMVMRLKCSSYNHGVYGIIRVSGSNMDSSRRSVYPVHSTEVDHSPPPPPPHHPPPSPPPHHPLPHYGFHLPKPEEEKDVKSIGVQGVIYCKAGSKLVPLKGAVARITCKAFDKHGSVSGSYTMMSDTDKSGYFLATMSVEDVKEVGNITECKGYLDMSSMESCSVPSNVNKGISGCPLAGPRLLHNKMQLYTVGPFEYIPVLPLGD